MNSNLNSIFEYIKDIILTLAHSPGSRTGVPWMLPLCATNANENQIHLYGKQE